MLALVFAIIFINAHTIFGHFQLRIFLVWAVVFPILLSVVMSAQGSRGGFAVIGGGLVGFLTMYGGGFLGIALGRRFPILPAPSIVRKSDEQLVREATGFLRMGTRDARGIYESYLAEALRRGFDLDARTAPLLKQAPPIDDPRHYYVRKPGGPVGGPWSVREIEKLASSGGIGSDWLVQEEAGQSSDALADNSPGWKPLSSLPFVGAGAGKPG